MGYAMFTARKMSLKAQINNYQLKLTQIANRQNDLTNKSAHFQKAQNMIDAKQARKDAELQNSKTMNDARGQIGQTMQAAGAKGGGIFGFATTVIGGGMQLGSSIQGRIIDGQMTRNEIEDINIDAKQSCDRNTFETEKAIEQQELDTEQQRLTTLLKAAEQELNNVEQAEEKAIQSSVPKYC